MAIFSVSDIRTFKQCRQLADFTLSARMGLRPVRPAIYYTVGDLAHTALEKYYNGEPEAWRYYDAEARKALVSWEGHPLYDKISAETTSFTYVLMAYMKRWAKANDRFTVTSTEVRDIIELSNGHHFTFKYDGLATKKDGSLWLIEFKTTGQLPNDMSWLQIDDQAAAYQWAVEELTGQSISGSIYTWFRKKTISKPRELVNGGLSVAKNIVTTADALYEAIVEAGYDPADYKDFIRFAANKEGDDFFLRTEVIAGRKQRALMAKHLERMTSEMGDPDTYMYASPSHSNCTNCSFFAPCAAKLLGLNWKALLEEDYEKGGYY